MESSFLLQFISRSGQGRGCFYKHSCGHFFNLPAHPLPHSAMTAPPGRKGSAINGASSSSFIMTDIQKLGNYCTQ